MYLNFDGQKVTSSFQIVVFILYLSQNRYLRHFTICGVIVYETKLDLVSVTMGNLSSPIEAACKILE